MVQNNRVSVAAFLLQKLVTFFSRKLILSSLVASSVLVIGTLLSFMTLLNNVSLGYVQSF